MHTLSEIITRNVDHYTKVQMHIDILTKELRALNFEPSSPFLALSGISLTCNESIDNVELAVDGDEVHNPIVAQKRGRLLHKRKMSAMEKATVKKSQKKKIMNHVTLMPFKGNEKIRLLTFLPLVLNYCH
jgi:hypothetical protein